MRGCSRVLLVVEVVGGFLTSMVGEHISCSDSIAYCRVISRALYCCFGQLTGVSKHVEDMVKCDHGG